MANKSALLNGRERRAIMLMYWHGRVTATEAADAIGIGSRQIVRSSPDGFDWDEARRAYLRRIIAARLRSAKDS